MRRREPPELVIFDCDGVLVDSERLAVNIEVELFAELGWELIPGEVADRFLGVSDHDYLRLIEEELGRPLPDGWLEMETRRLRQAFEEELEAVPGVEEVIVDLAARGIEVCVASSGSHEKIRHSLGLTGLLAHFEGRIFSATDVAQGKPAPDLFLYAAQTLGRSPARSLVVEDSPFGLEAALAAGMGAVAYSGGLVAHERLALEGVEVIDDMGDLTRLLLVGSVNPSAGRLPAGAACPGPVDLGSG